ncbi:hypothetical protein [Novipirellula sp.]|uniref:hypothetical protein n=1 Tax=Novipirellula sp. TaxID=2795430 RepID=UPI0035613AB7
MEVSTNAAIRPLIQQPAVPGNELRLETSGESLGDITAVHQRSPIQLQLPEAELERVFRLARENGRKP